MSETPVFGGFPQTLQRPSFTNWCAAKDQERSGAVRRSKAMNNRLQLPPVLQRELKFRRNSGIQHAINASLGVSLAIAVSAVAMLAVIAIPH